MKTQFSNKLYAFLITLLLAQNIFAQSPIHVVVEEGLTLDIYSDRYVINYFSPEYTIEQDTLVSLGQNQEILDECPNCYELPMNIEHYFSRIEFLGEYDAIDSTGFPALPVRGLNLQLPEDVEDIHVTVDKLTTSRVDFPYPYTPSLPISLASEYYSIVMHPYYESDGKGFFDNWHDASDTYGFMGTKGFAFNIFPLKYNPAEKYADMITSATFTVYFNSNISLIDMAEEYLSEKHFEDASIFYDTYKGLEGNASPADKGNYAILTHRDYVTALDEFVEYKKSIGYNVMVYSVPNDVAADKTKIRDFIKTLHKNNSTKPRFLLLVGNTTQIPYSRGSALSTDDPPTDIYYACIEKSNSDMRKEDMAPELYIGRWSVYDTDEVEYITHKTIKTELALYNTTQSNRIATLFSGSGKFSDWFAGDMKWLQNNVFTPTGMPSIFFDGRGNSSSGHQNMITVLTYLNPHIFVNSGHGASAELDAPWDLNYTDIQDGTLQNSHLPYQPFGFGFACKLNKMIIVYDT